MTTRRGILGMLAGVGALPAALSAQDGLVLQVGSGDQAPEYLVWGLRLRAAGLLVFERRCWEVIREFDGHQYGQGCGSYFRWLYPTSSQCPYCAKQFSTIMVSISANLQVRSFDNVYPLTLNFTGERGHLNEFEHPILDFKDDSDQWKEA